MEVLRLAGLDLGLIVAGEAILVDPAEPEDLADPEVLNLD